MSAPAMTPTAPTLTDTTVRTAAQTAGIGYVAIFAYGLDTLTYTLLPDYAAIAGIMLAIVAITSVIAELFFIVWLLMTGLSRPARAGS